MRIETVCRKKPRLTQGIEPGPLEQKSVALSLALPPLPTLFWVNLNGLGTDSIARLKFFNYNSAFT